MKALARTVLLFCVLLLSQTGSAGSDQSEEANFAAAQQELNRIAQTDLQTTSLSQIEILLQQVAVYLDQGKQCIFSTQQELEQADKALTALGVKTSGEPKDIGKERSSLQTLKNRSEVRLAQCRLLSLRATDLAKKLQQNKKEIFTRDLLARRPDIITTMRRSETGPAVLFAPVASFLFSGSGIDLLSPWSVGFIVFLTGMGLYFGGWIDSLISRHAQTIGREGFFFDLLRTTGRRKRTFQIIAASALLSLSLHLVMADLEPPPYLPSAMNGLLIILLLIILGKIYWLALAGQEQCVGKQLKAIRSGKIRLYVFALCSGLLWFVFAGPLSTGIPEATYYLLRTLAVTLWFGSLLWSFWFACDVSRIRVWRRMLRILLVFLMGGVTVVEFSGYHALAAYILAGTCGTLLLVLLLILGKHLLNELVGGFGRGRYEWQQALRIKAGVKPAHILRGIIWTNSLLKLALVVAFIYGLLRLWGISRVYASTFYNWLVDGFTLGQTTFVPSRIGAGFLFVAMGWTAVSLVKEKIIRKWLAESELAPSVQDALSTILGYIGYSMIILMGLSVAGINFTGLAMVAGALSVGIGFGLQNIVNNLVSGLILLFERPIKRGDWIVVGSTEGYVKQISVRSTIIQTFDRSDVIVPNSELISNQVTNMMLRDIRGRLRLPVGVAYGSNTILVKKILLELANTHPEIITNGTVPYPVVRFQAFGESSLDFELFCHLRDIDKRIDVRSDLHFSIDQSFRKHGIEIPFPQRDLHIKSGLHETKEQKKVEQEAEQAATA